MEIFSLYMSLYYIIPIGLLYLCIGNNNQIHNYALTKYNKFKSLTDIIYFTTIKNNSISNSNSNSMNYIRYWNYLKVISISLLFLFKALLYTLLQKINKSIVKKDGYYIITYYIKFKKYFIIVKPKFGPDDILQVLDEKLDDCTDLIVPYAGPHSNFHGSKLTPKFFDKYKLTFTMGDDTEYSFDQNDQIDLNM